MDQKSEEILRVLAAEGRISNIDLADRVALSPSATLRRVQDLERRGIISGYRAVIDREQTGGGFAVYVLVGLSDHTKAAQETFERSINLARAVRECHNIAGAHEYLLRVEVADLQAYKHFHTEILGTVAQVHSITSLVVMGTSKVSVKGTPSDAMRLKPISGLYWRRLPVGDGVDTAIAL